MAYQPNLADQFYHRYTYDAENRITLAETSCDSVFWEKEARYQYYKHGPLVRTVIGDQQVQGLDYAYTLHGWLKGVNSSSLAIGYDMGRDGDTTWLNRYVARDAFGFNLGFYTGDYATISTLATPFPGYSGLIGAQYKPLYNGNISSMVVNIGKFPSPLMYNYTYDQLNRITQLDVDSGFNQTTNTRNSTPSSISDYKERVAYDPNGNILQYLRNGTSSVNLNMDSLSYFYNRDSYGRLQNNQLNYIRDEVSGANQNSNYPSDIDDQSANNYAYDSIGNLVKDNAESITNIRWSVYGKILEIQRTATGTNPMTDLQYSYDAAGNRISKMVTNSTGPITYTWYARDAQGNVMSTYTSSGTGVYDSLYSLSLSEQHLYGSSRLGILTRNRDMKAAYAAPTFLTFLRGCKNYELSNHLGNVLVTISDKKLGVSSNGTTVDNYLADVRNANDYYPFGMLEPGRTYTASNTYRYGFNGKENDNEVKGQGNELDYGFRIFDSRTGRFLSTDPLTKTFPWYTPYQFAGNKPIWAKDLDGLEENTTSTYVYHSPVLGFKPAFKGVISISDATSQTAHKVFEGDFAKLSKSDPSKYSLGIVDRLVGNNAGNSNSRLDITITGTRSGTSKSWQGADMNYFTQYSYSFTSNNVTEIGTFELQNGKIQVSARAWDPLAFLLVNKVVSSIVTSIYGNELGIRNMNSFMSSANAESKNGLTALGRALQKHAGREGSSFADVEFSGKTANQNGVSVLNEILNSKNILIEKRKMEQQIYLTKLRVAA